MKEYYKTFTYKEEGKLEREVTICTIVGNLNEIINIGRTSYTGLFKSNIRTHLLFGYSIRRLVGNEVDKDIIGLSNDIAKGRALHKDNKMITNLPNQFYSKQVMEAISNRVYRNIIRDVINKLKD